MAKQDGEETERNKGERSKQRETGNGETVIAMRVREFFQGSFPETHEQKHLRREILSR